MVTWGTDHEAGGLPAVMFSTMEVRWFSRGAIPATVDEWFQRRSGEPEEQAGRVDYYLRSPEGDFLGIKLREGRLEIKQRHRQVGVIRFHRRVAGLVEHWRKWSAEPPPAWVAPSPSWIGVRKERRLYRYQLAGNGEMVAVSAADYTHPGCDLELTRIGVEDQRWWSLGLEAFGDEATIQDVLLLGAHQVLAGDQLPSLDPGDSYGYPRWLQLVEQRGNL